MAVKNLGRKVAAVVFILIVAVLSTIQNTSNLNVVKWNYNNDIDEQYTGNIRNTKHLQDQQHSLIPLAPPPKLSSFLLPKNNQSNFRPTTKIVRDCEVSPNQPVKKIHSFPQYEVFPWRTTTATKNNNVTSNPEFMIPCRFRNDHSTHFPHVMQQLYYCYTYWQDTLLRRNEQTGLLGREQEQLLLLVESMNMLDNVNKNPFVKGFLDVLETQLGVQIIITTESKQHQKQYLVLDGNKKNYYYNDTLVEQFTTLGGYIFSYVRELNRYVLDYFNDVQRQQNSTTKEKDWTLQNHERGDGCFSTSNSNTSITIVRHNVGRPIIAILNRKSSSGRSISNVDQLAKVLSEKITTVKPVTVQYFEGKSFQEQVEFFHQVDILLSPHGAQLTGIPFLATTAPLPSCNQLLELFPRGYEIPAFFGSLARNSGIGYSSVYLSENPPGGEQAGTVAERVNVRGQNLCPNPDSIVNIVQELVEGWRECCSSKQKM